MPTRRSFLRSSVLALAPTVPLFVARSARAAAPDRDARVLVVVELDGGNDALNTAVPFADESYARLRPTLRLAPKTVVRLTDAVGLHPALRPLDTLLQAGHLAALPGVGYPNPSRSHFESMAVWHSARPAAADPRAGYGWLGLALDEGRGDLLAVGGEVPAALRGRRSAAVAFDRADDLLLADPAAVACGIGSEPAADLLGFVRRELVDARTAADRLGRLGGRGAGTGYPRTGLAERLGLVARLLKADLGARVFYARQPGYDTHSQQQYTHAGLLGEFAGAVAAFFADLKAANLADRVALLAFSEFGRTVRENGSRGTDHGTAGLVLLAGPGVRGGLAGPVPSLTDLDGGEPKMGTDFRRVYAAALRDWLGVPAEAALGGRFDPLPLFRT